MLFIGEKPSIAEALAKQLSGNKYQKQQSKATPIFTFNYNGLKCTSTSVAGHVFQINFTKDYQSWDTDEKRLLEKQHTLYELCKGSGPILGQLRNLCNNVQKIIMALDNDREGENICFEIINDLKLPMNKIFRLRFSALTGPEIARAMSKLDKPNRNLSDAVEVRQELDLKVGVAFTRYMTKFFKEKYSNLNTQTVSYGPCQTPTLAFCVERQQEILHFRPQKLFGAKIILDNGIELQHPDESTDAAVAGQLREKIMKEECGEVIKQNTKKEKNPRPLGLNTVQMLRLASERLGISPADAMRKAEQLYIEGYITYPRTESSSYPAGFNFKEVLDQLGELSQYRDIIASIKQPSARRGVDAGDHPPITPTAIPFDGVDPLYSLIARNFIASVSADAEYEVIQSEIKIGDQVFKHSARRMINEGWMRLNRESTENSKVVPQLKEKITINSVSVTERYTKPPSHLTESALLGLMEHNQIGTDASMAQHVQNICDRQYVKLGPGRTLVPTELGIQLVQGLKLIDRELVSPRLRADMEAQLDKVANGQVTKHQMLNTQLNRYSDKFTHFCNSINLMDQLFEAKFITLKDAGKPFVQCPNCYRFTKLVSSTPQRLYCATCDRIYECPQRGRLVEAGRVCACCQMRLVSNVISGKDRRLLFCPKCYTDGSDVMDKGLEYFGITQKNSRHLPCNQCMNANCQMSLVTRYVGECCCGATDPYDERVKQYQNEEPQEQSVKEEKGNNNNKQQNQINEQPSIVIKFDDDVEEEKPLAKQKANANEVPIPHKLYLDNTAMPNAQIQCTSCLFVANLPQGKADVAQERCSACGCHKIYLKSKEKEVTQCPFCEMEGVDVIESKAGISKYGNRGNGQHQRGHGGKRPNTGQGRGHRRGPGKR